MKYEDDYDAKLRIWVQEAKCRPTPRLANLPRFGSRKFSSYAEFNAWKADLIRQLAEQGGARWRK